ncbi:hypothetical protein H6P81_012121 [Aristolochia fimbriata]|uniref:Uncharacterized protein n=1 Tax=Aristolochia fimbriata TaxID=158543 RepID=A0AAV7EB91_ARIFI|nr:hypothetical protein H6P81_012121 [Aristolochia fimbriata]
MGLSCRSRRLEIRLGHRSGPVTSPPVPTPTETLDPTPGSASAGSAYFGSGVGRQLYPPHPNILPDPKGSLSSSGEGRGRAHPGEGSAAGAATRSPQVSGECRREASGVVGVALGRVGSGSGEIIE